MMALAKMCDACGSFFKPTPNEEIPNGITFSYFDLQGRVQNTIERMELCPACLQKVRNVLSNNNTEEE